MPRRLVVIGGGISGLAAATAAAECAVAAGQPLEVVLLEREPAVGGKARSFRAAGWLVECGPTGYLDEDAVVEELAGRAGLGDEAVEATEAAKLRYLVLDGRLRRVPSGPVGLARSGLLGPGGLLRLAVEPFVPARRGEGEESVWSFAARRIGRQAADRLIAPMVLGVFAGDARRLSVEAAFPRLVRLEREHGSLLRGLLAGRRQGTVRGGPSGPAAPLRSFRSGLEALPAALAASGRFSVRTGVEVRAVARFPSGGLEVRGPGPELHADAVVLATEPWAIASLLELELPSAAALLRQIACPPVTVVALGYSEEEAARVPFGFGALVRPGEGFRILGCLWDTHLFPGRAPGRCVLVRSLLGGAVDPSVAAFSEEEVVALVRRDLERLLGIRSAPIFRHVVAWPRAIPQYEIGHLQRAAAIESAVAAAPGIFLAGNGLRGISFARAAAAGVRAGREAARFVLRARPV